MADLLSPHAPWGTPSRGVWARSWDRVPNPQNLSISLLPHQDSRKGRCRSQAAFGALGSAAAASHTQPGTLTPAPLPDEGDSGEGDPVLASPLINSHNSQPGQALPLIAALQCFAGQLLNQQEQPPGQAESPARGQGLCEARAPGLLHTRSVGTEGVFC